MKTKILKMDKKFFKKVFGLCMCFGVVAFLEIRFNVEIENKSCAKGAFIYTRPLFQLKKNNSSSSTKSWLSKRKKDKNRKPT